MLRPSPGENEPQNRMCLLAYHKTMSGLYFIAKSAAMLWQDVMRRIQKDSTTKRLIIQEDRGEHMT